MMTARRRDKLAKESYENDDAQCGWFICTRARISFARSRVCGRRSTHAPAAVNHFRMQRAPLNAGRGTINVERSGEWKKHLTVATMRSQEAMTHRGMF